MKAIVAENTSKVKEIILAFTKEKPADFTVHDFGTRG